MSKETVEISLRFLSATRKTAVRCPFHAERTPSCAIDLDRAFFHCFGCGRAGEVKIIDRNIETMTVDLTPDANRPVKSL